MHPKSVPPRFLVHQEGVLCLIAFVGLSIRDGGPFVYLAPRGHLIISLTIGISVGFLVSLSLFLVRQAPMIAALEAWQRELVRGWHAADALAVAFISGVAEEALLRALLQPLIGLIPAALVFALLHFVPDQRLWMWPFIALAAGLLFGVVYEHYGYPAAAAAHVILNTISLTRLTRSPP